MASTQKTKIETFHGPIIIKRSRADGDHRTIRRKGPVYLVLSSLALCVPLATVSISVSTAVVAKERMRASDLAGTWKGTDGREYTIKSSLQGRISLRIKGPETKIEQIVESSPTLTLTYIGAETFGDLEYTGKFDATGSTVKARLSYEKNFRHSFDKNGRVFSRLSKRYPVVHNFITLKFIDQNKVSVQRSLSKIRFTVTGTKTEITPLYKIETATLTKDGADPKLSTDSANPDTQGDNRVAESENDQEKKPGVFFCYRDDQFVKVTKDTPCAKSAQKWLSSYDNGIDALRNLLAKVSDLNSAAAKTSKAELKRYREEKAELLEAIKREAEVAQQANDNAKPVAAAGPLDNILADEGPQKATGGFRVTHSVNGSFGYEEMTNAAGVIVQRKTIDRSTQKLLTLDLSDRIHPNGQVARDVKHTFTSSGGVSTEITSYTPNGDFLHRAWIRGTDSDGRANVAKWNPKTRKFEMLKSKGEHPINDRKYKWNDDLKRWKWVK